MPIPMLGAVHANFIGSLLGQTVMTGAWFQSKVANGSMSGLGTGLAALATTALPPASSAELQWTEVTVFDPRPDGEATYHRNLGALLVGTVTGDCLPPQCSLLTHLTGGFKSGRRRGRTLFPGIAEATQSNGLASGPQFDAIVAYHNALMTQYGPSGTDPNWQWVVYSPEKLTATPPRPGILITPITSHSPDAVVRTLHRRMLGVGA